jgi:hypothetical protein
MSSSKQNWPVKGLSGRYLSEFIDLRYSQSCLYFLPSFVKRCPSNLLSGSTLSPFPLLPSLCEKVNCNWGVIGFGPQTENHCRKASLQVNFFRLQHFALPSMSLIFLLYRFMYIRRYRNPLTPPATHAPSSKCSLVRILTVFSFCVMSQNCV